MSTQELEQWDMAKAKRPKDVAESSDLKKGTLKGYTIFFNETLKIAHWTKK